MHDYNDNRSSLTAATLSEVSNPVKCYKVLLVTPLVLCISYCMSTTMLDTTPAPPPIMDTGELIALQPEKEVLCSYNPTPHPSSNEYCKKIIIHCLAALKMLVTSCTSFKVWKK